MDLRSSFSWFLALALRFLPGKPITVRMIAIASGFIAPIIWLITHNFILMFVVASSVVCSLLLSLPPRRCSSTVQLKVL